MRKISYVIETHGIDTESEEPGHRSSQGRNGRVQELTVSCQKEAGLALWARAHSPDYQSCQPPISREPELREKSPRGLILIREVLGGSGCSRISYPT